MVHVVALGAISLFTAASVASVVFAVKEAMNKQLAMITYHVTAFVSCAVVDLYMIHEYLVVMKVVS